MALVLGGGTVAAKGGGPHPLRHYDERLFANALATVQRQPVQDLTGARVLVVPHHWVAGPLILGPLRDLAASRPVHRVVLIGPDHRDAAGWWAVTSDWSWSTPFGTVAADPAGVAALARGGLARPQPEVLTDEHSVAGLMPAVARLLPGATVVPLVLRADTPRDHVQRLSGAIAPLMDEGTVLVTAVDFAHQVPPRDVPRRNAESIAALRALDGAAVMGWGDEHLDSSPAIALAMAVARRLGATRFTLLADSDSTHFAAPVASGVTSYVVGYYR